MKQPSNSLGEREIEIRRRLRDDFPHYASKCLNIRTKAGKVEPLSLNRAQRYLHERLEQQLKDKGRVRALILKGRQQGCSTYVGGRYYHTATHKKGQRVFILTHEQEATDNLFDMVTRYHDNCPAPVRPHTGAANAKELDFDKLDSGYKVGTAGTKAVGRSQTIQLFHGSEVAFWPHATTHAAGVIQAVPDLPETEVILESTANGFDPMFHPMWQQAEAGQSDYIAIFIPWYWQEEYRKPADGFSPTPEEEEYAKAYGLDNEQLAWRRAKIAELRDELLFKQEYPATAAEAFQLTGHDSYIPAALVLKARKAKCEAHGPLVLGVDPSRYGGDRFSIAHRRGRKVLKIENKTGLDVVGGAAWVRQVIDAEKPTRVFIDVGGIGAGIVDILRSWGYSDIVVAVDFGGSPHTARAQGGPKNRRAEMWLLSKEWLEDPGGADLPDTDSLQADATAPSYKYDIHGLLQIESKESMRNRGVRSPDEWDAVGLTFAEPVQEPKRKASPKPTSWMG